MLKTALVSLSCLVGLAHADLRMASQPRGKKLTDKHIAYAVQQRSHTVRFEKNVFPVYMEPSDFMYQGLMNQRGGGGYDNFLRSNIDNEQDRRNFNTEDGKDHLPFRSYEGAGDTAGQSTIQTKLKCASMAATGVTEAGCYIQAAEQVPYVVPLRWNNPHSAELEVNIWILKKHATKNYVVPVLRPTCSGEGYQDNVFDFKIPKNFPKNVCNRVGDCVLQIYAHSVESRMYSMGTPIIVSGCTGDWSTAIFAEAEMEVGLDLKNLTTDICRSRGDPQSHIADTKVFDARLTSDQYNHAYQNSDFSPYGGQQPLWISMNMQAACILKMTANNFGELGREYMQRKFPQARHYAKKLDKKARNLIRQYETVTNSIIEAIQYKVANSDSFYTSAKQEASKPDPVTGKVTNMLFCGDPRADPLQRTFRSQADKIGGYCPEGFLCVCRNNCRFYNPKEHDAYCTRVNPGTTTRTNPGNDTARQMILQYTEITFRGKEMGSTVKKRHNTNTYIPSFEIIGQENVELALEFIAPRMLKSGFLQNPTWKTGGIISSATEDKAHLNIYMAVLQEMWPEFQMASNCSYLEKFYKRTWDDCKGNGCAGYCFTYRGSVIKSTMTTMSDKNDGIDYKFRKMNAANQPDKGYYSAAKAWKHQARPTAAGLKIGSSVPFPQTPGPLSPPLDLQTDTSLGDITIAFPPGPSIAAVCVSRLAQAMDASITPENLDMDGLNFDADCDDQNFVEKHNAVWDKKCEARELADPTDLCGPYPEPPCNIPGQAAALPGQMFSNDYVIGKGGINSGAGSMLPSLAALLLTVAAALKLN